jgi:hypothetical protein
MIIRIFDERTQREEYIIAVHHVPTEEEFLRRARVRPDSYAGRLMSKLFARLFSISLELKRDYATYYQTEYQTFALYLRKRHLLSLQDAQQLETRHQHASAIIHFGRLYTFMEEGMGADLLEKLLDLEA